MDTHHYDIISIGAGSAGLSTALSMNKLGFKALLVDKNENNIGGDCLNWGCVPSKALIHISRMVHEARQAEHFGLQVSGDIDVDAVMNYIHEKQDIIRAHENADFFRKEGLDIVIGEARFHDARSVVINDTIYSAKKIIIATGSQPRKIDLPGIQFVNACTNEDVFDLKELPKDMVVIGAGPIGLELGQAFARLGVNVSVIDRADRILLKEEKDIGDILKTQMEKEGLNFYLGAEPKEVQEDKTFKIEQNGEMISLACDTILFAIGRTLNHKNLQLEKAGIKTKDGKLVTNSYLQTSNRRVHVCGDALGSLQFSHGAELHARIILNNFFSPLKKKLSYKNFSWVTFTSPEVATFGMTRAELDSAGKKYEKLSLDFTDDDRAIVDDYQYGKLILLVTPTNFINKNPKILGGTMIAPNAGEMCQELILANSNGLRLNALFDKIYSYPTASRVNQAIVVNKKMQDITPFVKKLLKIIY